MESVGWSREFYDDAKKKASQVTLVKNPPAIAGDLRDTISIPGLGRSPGGGRGTTDSSILAWRIPWTEEPGRCRNQETRKKTHPHTNEHLSHPPTDLALQMLFSRLIS